MKFKLLYIVFLLAAVFGCEKKGGGTETEPEQETGFVATGWNGHLVEAMAGAYDYFLENDEMPATITIAGDELPYERGWYISAGSMVLKAIIADPGNWQDEPVDFLEVNANDNWSNNTLDSDEMTLEDFVQVLDDNYDFVREHSRFANYCTVRSSYTDADGSTFSVRMPINVFAVMLARIFDYYVDNQKLPETVSTWYSDFLRETSNCQVSDPAVVAAMTAATAGAETDMQKAEAIFEYARDEWEYDYYSNTSRGAVKTIEEKAGNCCDMSHGIVAMARAAGIPARYKHAQCQFSIGVIGHVVAELYVDGTWYLCDATNNSNTFGHHESWSVMTTFNSRYKELPF